MVKTKDTPPTPCPGCGGSGQTGYFGGESRFMITWQDCPDCAGTGIVLEDDAQAQKPLSPEQEKD